MPGDVSPEPIDLLAIGAHPDDAELLAGGTLALLAKRGKRVGILDLTRGECGTRGTPESRAAESLAANRILGIAERVTLDLGDSRLENSNPNRQQVVNVLRRLRPSVVVTHFGFDRHPDHARAHELVRDACFLANVGGYPADGERHQVGALAFFFPLVGVDPRTPDWVVDISETFETKLKALKAYRTQFYPGDTANKSAMEDEPQTYLASKDFWEMIDAHSRRWGQLIGARYGEAFLFQQPAHAEHAFVRLLK